MQKPNVETMLLLAAGLFLGVTQSWPAVVAFLGAGSLYAYRAHNETKSAQAAAEVLKMRQDLAKFEKALEAISMIASNTEARVTMIENTNQLQTANRF